MAITDSFCSRQCSDEARAACDAPPPPEPDGRTAAQLLSDVKAAIAAKGTAP